MFNVFFRLEINIEKKQVTFTPEKKHHYYYLLICRFMKRGILFSMLLALALPVLTAQNVQIKNNPVGNWKFEAPYAPEGYTSGNIVVGIAEQKHTANLSFTGSDFTLAGENVKAVNDSLLFSVYLEGQDIKVMLKIENATKMSGKAVYSGGEVPLALTKNSALEETKK
jgi:hypothetical protein